MTWASVAALIMALAGCCYLAAAAILIGRVKRKASQTALTSAPAVTLLKPLYGADEALFENLVTFSVQAYPGPIQIICGVQDGNDPAIAVVKRLRLAHPERTIELVVDDAVHGSNRKVSNLINMMQRARHDIIVLADADMRVDDKYLSRVIAALQADGVGGVTCLYYETASAGLSSRLSALGVNGHFLPSIVVGLALGRAQPCFGSTIALRRTTLDAIGGFASVADCLADDYEIGKALRGGGQSVAIPPFAVAHVVREMTAREMWDHELRWSRTIKTVDPLGYAGSVVTHPLAWGVAATLLGVASPTFWPAIATIIAAVVGRALLLRRVEQAFELPPQTYWLLPLRDLLSCVVFVASFLGREVSWKGFRYRVVSDGTLVPQGRSPRS